MTDQKRGYSVTHDDIEYPKTFRLQDPQGVHLAEIVYDVQEDALLLSAAPKVRSALIYHLIERALCDTC